MLLKQNWGDISCIVFVRTEIFNETMDKENCNVLHEKKANSIRPARNPFSELSENVLPQSAVNTQIIRKRVTRYRSVKTCETKPRTNSASSMQVKELKYFFKSENITERRKDENEDEVFVEGKQHFVNYLADKKSLSIKRTKSEEVESKIVQTQSEVKKPAQKVTLAKKLSSRHKRYKIEDFFKDCLYDLDYFEDNYRYMLHTEENFVYRRTYLKKYADEGYRLLIVNWLIHAQQILNLTENTLFVAVRMFDYLLASAKIVNQHYSLVAIVCLWIANKSIDVNLIQVPKLFALCNGKFSKEQIISTERKLLIDLKFKVNFPEPVSFLYYYLKREKLEKDQKIFFSTMFLIENFALMIGFSSVNPSLLTAIALYIVLVKYGYDSTSFLEYINNHLVEKTIFKRKSDEMLLCVGHLLKAEGFTNEVVAKYSREEKFRVAQDFISV